MLISAVVAVVVLMVPIAYRPPQILGRPAGDRVHGSAGLVAASTSTSTTRWAFASISPMGRSANCAASTPLDPGRGRAVMEQVHNCSAGASGRKATC
jgi:hypothetical protein